MFQLTRKIEYSLIVLHHIATERKKQGTQQKNHISPLYTAKMIANHYGIPEMHTAKTFQILCKKGILSSKQGTKGGYRLAKALEDVTLYDLIENIEGPFGIVRCTTDQADNTCNYSPFCNIIDPMQNLNLKLINFYKSTTLKELLENTPHNSTSTLTPLISKIEETDKNNRNQQNNHKLDKKPQTV